MYLPALVLSYSGGMRLLERVISIVAPFSCLRCGSERGLVCIDCLDYVLPELPERCYRCYALTRDSRVCRSCRSVSSLTHVWVATEYASYSKDLVHRLKFERAQAAAAVMAAAISKTLPYLDEQVVISSIPTASSRVRQRGYDHARLIAQELARIRKLHYLPFLHRLGQTRQVGAKRSQRLVQLRGAYRPRNKPALKGKTILLIDDVLTTGASLEEAAKVLRANGAKHVYGAVFAQKK